jgi:predicted NBD/HSP70 family sugar kinase
VVRAVARPDDIRRHNLGLLLEQVHRDGELSRAELTQRLGLNRSTIGALVSDLTEFGLLSEFVPTTSVRAGRPSHVVGPRADGPFAIAVDLEVERIASAAVGIGGRVLVRHDSVVPPGERSPQRVASLIAEHVEHLLGQTAAGSGSWPVGVGISIPGTITRSDGRIGVSPNLDWQDLAFAEIVEQYLPLPLTVDLGNDADLGVLAEHLRGAARSSNDVVYITGRIGVGAGILVDGLPLRGHRGVAGEIGHVMLDPTGEPCHCGSRGCVETFIGEAALLRAVGSALTPGHHSVSWFFESVRSGDPVAIGAMQALAEPLGRTIATLVNILNPELVVLGGVLSGVLQVAGAEVEASVQRHSFGTADPAVLLAASGLGHDSSLIGAADLAFQRLLADPFSRP